MNVKLLEQSTSLLFRSQKAGALFGEMRDRFLEECDYELEAERLVRFRKLFAERPELEFPKPFPKYSSKRVLTMSRLTGVPFDAFVRNAPQQARDHAAKTLWSFQFESVLRHRQLGALGLDPTIGVVG
jgi:predicted unusual protein kinase regulating ubiquinone biosynthesis (AarF/ABC1/UbiB family)